MEMRRPRSYIFYKIVNRTGCKVKFWPSSKEDRETITFSLDDALTLLAFERGKEPKRTLLGQGSRMSYAAPISKGQRIVSASCMVEEIRDVRSSIHANDRNSSQDVQWNPLRLNMELVGLSTSEYIEDLSFSRVGAFGYELKVVEPRGSVLIFEIYLKDNVKYVEMRSQVTFENSTHDSVDLYAELRDVQELVGTIGNFATIFHGDFDRFGVLHCLLEPRSKITVPLLFARSALVRLRPSGRHLR